MAELVKLKIEAYSEANLSESSRIGEYIALVNPSQYTKVYKIEYTEPEVLGAPAKIQYKFTPSTDVDLEFLFDSTGIIDREQQSLKEQLRNAASSFRDGGSPASENNDTQSGITKKIEDFLKIVYAYNGNDHKPNYLKIIWGTEHFACMLSDVSIEYKLFASDGAPIRAVAKAKFKRFIDDKLLEAEKKNSSPDLTHVRTVNEGDTLPLMTKKIYGDSKYYLEVARVNKLTTFRKLKTGQQIYFPPLEKIQ